MDGVISKPAEVAGFIERASKAGSQTYDNATIPPTETNMIEPYTIAVPDKRLAAIRGKVADYDWNQLSDAGGWRSGVGKVDHRRMVDYWLHDYDWRASERRLNRFSQFIVDIEGSGSTSFACAATVPARRCCCCTGGRDRSSSSSGC